MRILRMKDALNYLTIRQLNTCRICNAIDCRAACAPASR